MYMHVYTYIYIYIVYIYIYTCNVTKWRDTAANTDGLTIPPETEGMIYGTWVRNLK